VPRGRKILISAKSDNELVRFSERVLERLVAIGHGTSFELFAEEGNGRGTSFKNSAQLLDALVKGIVDIAIVEGNDLAVNLDKSIDVVSVLTRGNPFDVFISSDGFILDEQDDGARIAVGNLTQKGQMLYYRPDFEVVIDRGSFSYLEERLKDGIIDGFVYSGLRVEAIGKQDVVAEVFTSSICMPEAGQGVIALLCRKQDRKVQSILKELNDPACYAEFILERKFVCGFLSDIKVPAGVLSSVEGSECRIEAMVVAPDGSERISASVEGKVSNGDKLIANLKKELMSSGAEELIQAYK